MTFNVEDKLTRSYVILFVISLLPQVVCNPHPFNEEQAKNFDFLEETTGLRTHNSFKGTKFFINEWSLFNYKFTMKSIF